MSYINRSDITVKNVVLLRSATMLARASVIFYEVVETHGWKVLKSNKMHPRFGEELWIQAPSYKKKWQTGQSVNPDPWRETVYINDRRTRDLVEDMVYDAYHVTISRIENQESTVEKEADCRVFPDEKLEDINPEDIPF